MVRGSQQGPAKASHETHESTGQHLWYHVAISHVIPLFKEPLQSAFGFGFLVDGLVLFARAQTLRSLSQVQFCARGSSRGLQAERYVTIVLLPMVAVSTGPKEF